MARYSPSELKTALRTGMLAFPLTDFDAEDKLDLRASAARLDWLASYRPAVFFMAGGAGEFFSLTLAEYEALLASACTQRAGNIPIVGASGYGTRMAIEFAQASERSGADGILLMPPYLVESPQEGLREHIAAICKATNLGVIVYNRANCRVAPETVSRLAEECPNLIGFKDGAGDVENNKAIVRAVGDRLIYLNGMPTAETYAREFLSHGFSNYSSAMFNFAPRAALEFQQLVLSPGAPATTPFETEFLNPYVALRSRGAGYAVSIVKAGATIVGRSAGRTRPPLTDVTAQEMEILRELIGKLGPQE